MVYFVRLCSTMSGLATSDAWIMGNDCEIESSKTSVSRSLRFKSTVPLLTTRRLLGLRPVSLSESSSELVKAGVATAGEADFRLGGTSRLTRSLGLFLMGWEVVEDCDSLGA